MPQNDASLTTEANIIKNETSVGANTATRVGTMLIDLIDNKINNDKIATSTSLGTSDTVVPSQNAVKVYADSTKLAKSTNLLSIDDTGIADNQIAIYDLTNKKIKTSAKTISIDGTFAANSDALVPTQKAVKTYITSYSFPLPYKSYMALLTDNAKTLETTVLYDNLGRTLSLSVPSSSVGTYLITATAGGTFQNAMIFISNTRESSTATNINIVCSKSADNTTIKICTFQSGVLSDGILNKTPIEIRIIP